ncbi:MAG: peptide chain release factor N(5)-glutamine methyltransferase [Clostridiales bacterium]|nr:peptide chain release factor N(5)-glutamine methyltransferase [Clostridiales bacterium]
MKTKIGGQAVLEGVMMRGATSMALAVRDELGNIRMDTTRLATKKPWYRRVPFLRGVVNLIVSMIDGSKIISKSAEVMVEEVDTKGDGGMGWLMGISTVLGVALALGLFVVLPTYVTKGVFALAQLDTKNLEWAWLKSLIEGVAKMLILVVYMVAISQMKEIKRVFMYHGAEHKTIACFESEMPLTVENVQKCSRYHDRCGTSFIVFVVVLSVVLMMVLDIVCAAVGFTLFLENWWLRALLKIALLPVTAGISYEMLMLLACSNFILFRPLKWLGKQFQKLTTREPDDGMCEVAIAAFNKVLEMDADVTIPEEHFPAPVSLAQFRTQVLESGLTECVKGDIDWLLTSMLNIKKEDLSKDTIKIPYGWTLRLEKMKERIAAGEPWQYVVGKTEFYGRTYVVNKDVLIPRQETELVCEQLLKRIDKKSKVLDLCCGSGVIGITAALAKGASVDIADVSKKALKVAKLNAKLNKANVQLIESDMFEEITDMYNVIVCNPPYIESDVIDTLDDSVKNYEPKIALDGGDDGLDFYRQIATVAPHCLFKNGLLVLEIGYNQGEAVKALLEEKFEVQVLKDYSDNDRIVIAKLK